MRKCIGSGGGRHRDHQGHYSDSSDANGNTNDAVTRIGAECAEHSHRETHGLEKRLSVSNLLSVSERKKASMSCTSRAERCTAFMNSLCYGRLSDRMPMFAHGARRSDYGVAGIDASAIATLSGSHQMSTQVYRTPVGT